MKNTLIGAVHFPPLLGYPDHPGLEVCLRNAQEDIDSFQKAGFDGIILENNYDSPHYEHCPGSVISSFTYLATVLKSTITLPIGISVLWNDYQTALSIAACIDASFIRVPVLVDTVETSYGIMQPPFEKVKEYRDALGCKQIKIYADIHVKHATILSHNTLEESAKKALDCGADGLILTGNWTGEAPETPDLISIKSMFPEVPLIIGSGLNYENATSLFQYANAAIVSTSVKEGQTNSAEVNVKKYTQRISLEKCRELRTKILN